MIGSETPYKLSEIIQDTWPMLYRPPNKRYNNVKLNKTDDWKSGTRRECDEKRRMGGETQ